VKLSLYDRYKPAGIRGGVEFRLTLKWVLCANVHIKGTVHHAISPKPVTLHPRSLMGNYRELSRAKEAKGKRGVTVCGTTDSRIERLWWEDAQP
jgi:hypothetical protein